MQLRRLPAHSPPPSYAEEAHRSTCRAAATEVAARELRVGDHAHASDWPHHGWSLLTAVRRQGAVLDLTAVCLTSGDLDTWAFGPEQRVRVRVGRPSCDKPRCSRLAGGIR